jgi:hypothetical protein
MGLRWIALAGLLGMALIGGAVWAPIEEPTLEERAAAILRADELKQRIVLDRYLCRKMAACSKYDRVRVDCATAADTETCLRIKMGDDFRDVETCGVDYEGGPAALLDPRTPNALRCFFLNATR